jgi:hypothetical protein
MFKLSRRTLGLAAIIAAASAPPASYARAERHLTPAQRQQLEAYQQAVTKSFGPTPGGLAGPVMPLGSVSRHAAGRAASSQRSFHWDDAGIGAGIMSVLFGAGASTVAVVMRRGDQAATRRDPRPR